MEKRDVLLSVKPAYACLLVDGIKTVELRRKFPVDLPTGTRCLIYSSSPTKKVIGECKIAKVECLKIRDLWKVVSIEAMISWADFKSYFTDVEYGYAIHVYAAYRYPLERALRQIGKDIVAPQSYRYLPWPDRAATI